MIKEAKLLWKPSRSVVDQSNIAIYMQWLEKNYQLVFTDYDSLWSWSVSSPEDFWESIWRYFDVQSDSAYKQVIGTHGMQCTTWFEGATVNYAEHLLRHEAASGAKAIAFQYLSEFQSLKSISRGELGRKVRIVATQLRKMGVKPGDRVVSYMPNVPETAVAMIASVAIGAVWSSAALEFGVKTVTDRFSQIEPKVIFAADGYSFGGKPFSRNKEVMQLVSALPTLKKVIWFEHIGTNGSSPNIPHLVTWVDLLKQPDVPRENFRFERVSHDHPLWILFSSGTTGLPKAIVHSHAGILVEHLKLMHFHLDLSADSVMFFYSTTGWMMWNLLLATLLTGGSSVLYDGSPVYPEPSFLWKLAADTGTTSFGVSPTFLQIMEKEGIVPSQSFDLSKLETVLIAGSPSTPENFEWLYDKVKRDLWVTSQSGGTEICSAFVGAIPILPVYAGEIQTRCLGMDVHTWDDDGKEVFDEVGELVVTSPFPSMPIYFWNDENNQRYHESYFDTFPNVWRHGDFLKINKHGGCYISGRSDSTLNRYGVRIGTIEIYRIVESIEDVLDSLVVCCELPNGEFFMPLFVQFREGVALTDSIRSEMCSRLREDCSPRHVPDGIYQVEAVPYTLTSKKMEVPIRKILMGQPHKKVMSRDAMANPAAIDYFIAFAQSSKDYQWRV